MNRFSWCQRITILFRGAGSSEKMGGETLKLTLQITLLRVKWIKSTTNWVGAIAPLLLRLVRPCSLYASNQSGAENKTSIKCYRQPNGNGFYLRSMTRKRFYLEFTVASKNPSLFWPVLKSMLYFSKITAVCSCFGTFFSEFWLRGHPKATLTIYFRMTFLL